MGRPSTGLAAQGHGLGSPTRPIAAGNAGSSAGAPSLITGMAARPTCRFVTAATGLVGRGTSAAVLARAEAV